MARTLAKKFAAVFEDECAPFQNALSTRAGTDCVGHMFRAVTDANLNATMFSMDGIGVYDHVMRASMLGRLVTMLGGVLGILPFVRLSYANPSRCSWWDEDGQRRTVVQAEEGEQGDLLMPLLFAIGIQAGLEEIHTTFLPGEQLCAFLDDVYALCDPERVKAIHDTLAECLWRVADIQLHGGKTKVWNKGRVPPPTRISSGQEAWQPEGIKVLGTPIGSEAFIREMMRIADEQRLWDAIPRVPNLQCSWQLLVQSAGARANHVIRTLPPELSAEYASEHDRGMWRTVVAFLGLMPGTPEQLDRAKIVASLPMRMGGLGLRSAGRCAGAAYWASLADAIPRISYHNPTIANSVVESLSGDAAHQEDCLVQFHECGQTLERRGISLHADLVRAPRRVQTSRRGRG